jgi:hypothetical protein
MDALGGATGAVPANELRQVTSLLWTSIEASLHPAEFPEVRRALGVSALEENERLMEEATALAEIIGDVRHRVDTAAHRRLNAQKSLYSNPSRALVEGELRLLIASIKKTAAGDATAFVSASASSSVAGSRPHSRQSSRPGSHQGTRPLVLSDDVRWSDIGTGSANDPTAFASNARDGLRDENALLSRLENQWAEKDDESVTRLLASTAEERALLEYVTRSAQNLNLGSNHRPHSASSSSRPQSSSRPSSSHSSLESSAAVERLGKKINAFDVDAVAGRLRTLLFAEKEALLEDIEYLRLCLEDEAEFMAENLGRAADAEAGDGVLAEEEAEKKPPPGVAELRRYGARLREVYAEEKERAEHEARVERLISAGGGGDDRGANENAPRGQKAGRLEPVRLAPAGRRKTESVEDGKRMTDGAPRVSAESPLAPAPPPTAPRPPAGGRAAAFRRRVG